MIDESELEYDDMFFKYYVTRHEKLLSTAESLLCWNIKSTFVFKEVTQCCWVWNFCNEVLPSNLLRFISLLLTNLLYLLSLIILLFWLMLLLVLINLLFFLLNTFFYWFFINYLHCWSSLPSESLLFPSKGSSSWLWNVHLNTARFSKFKI